MRRFPVWLLALPLLACGDDDECHEAGTARCTEDGRAIERCLPQAEGGADLGWRREACPEATPSCVEHGDRDAVCVAERVGECDFDRFEDRCIDEHTLEDCVAYRAGEADGAKHRIRCPEGERCGEVPRHALALGRPPNATHACHAPRPRTEPPALVTFTAGSVRLGDEPAPEVPFRVPAGTPLHLGADARAVVLVQERPSRLEGPAEVDVYDRQPEDSVPSPSAQAVIDALAASPGDVAPEEPLLSPAPSERGVIRLWVGEGMPGASADLPDVRWRCDEDCGRTVTLRESGRSANVLWRATGERTVAYDGPPLEPGQSYGLEVGDRSYRVETRRPPDVRVLLDATRGWPLAEQMSVIAAVQLRSGSRAAAVQTLWRSLIERPASEPLRRLLEAYDADPPPAPEP
ncbi:MAG TPA: hypothetical protein RMH99_05745 [Sandaracinaceae bacterium LLY-WYZ-13_1]|nr:hypothetical protein [Sandaracinaceae bacterium LLY-WYZ-13_1]